MARLDYPDPDADPEARALVDRIVAERGELLHLYHLLLHSPPVAEGWLAFLTAIRQRSRLDPAVRELVIMRVAVLNGAPYEASQHAPLALAEGVTQAQLDALEDWESAAGTYSSEQRAVLAYTDAMTRDVAVPDAVFVAVREHFDDRGMVELTATVAAYNLVSRFLEALQIRESDSR